MCYWLPWALTSHTHGHTPRSQSRAAWHIGVLLGGLQLPEAQERTDWADVHLSELERRLYYNFCRVLDSV